MSFRPVNDRTLAGINKANLSQDRDFTGRSKSSLETELERTLQGIETIKNRLSGNQINSTGRINQENAIKQLEGLASRLRKAIASA